MKAGFFAIGSPQWADACGPGLNPAVAYLVAACGTGRDNITTRWSAEAVRKYTGMGWLRARTALDALDGCASIVASVATKGGNPSRKLVVPDDADRLLWLPNTLVTGAGNEMPPVAKLRQSQNLNACKPSSNCTACKTWPAMAGCRVRWCTSHMTCVK